MLARADLCDDADPLTAGGFVFEMVAEHEAQHSETVLQALQMLPAGAYVRRRGVPCRGAPAPAAAGSRSPAATFAMGANGRGFAYDCERPRHVRSCRRS